MVNNNSIGVFIAGRLGSERLPQKLLLPIGESCLWDMACKKLNALSGRYGRYVLAEKGELAYMAKKYEHLQVIIRDPGTAIVDSPLSYIFKDLRNLPERYLMFLNPCQSFLTVGTIVEALEKFAGSGCEYGTSVKHFKNWLFDNQGQPVNKINYQHLSTKEIEPFWQAAHCFHIFNKNRFFEDGFMLKPGCVLLPVPDRETLDVDTYEDYEFVRWKHEICN